MSGLRHPFVKQAVFRTIWQSRNASAAAMERIADAGRYEDGQCRTGKNCTLSFFL